MSQYQEDTRDDVLKKAEKLQTDGWETYLNPWVVEKLSGNSCFLSFMCDGPKFLRVPYLPMKFLQNSSPHHSFACASRSPGNVTDKKACCPHIELSDPFGIIR